MSDTITTWRNVPGLTAQQVDQMERFEGYISGVAHHPQAQQQLIDHAHMLVEQAEVDARFAGVPLPDGATTDSESWGVDETTGRWSRSVEWAQFATGVRGVAVHIDGMQTVDGLYSRDVALYAEDCRLTAEQARALAAALVAAADELERLNPYPVDSQRHQCCRGIGRHSQGCEDSPPFQ